MALTITGSISTSLSLSGGDNPVLVTGTIDVAAGYALYGAGGPSANWTITNAGLINSANSAHAHGILLGQAEKVASARVTNTSAGTIAGGKFGVYIYGPGYVLNGGGGASAAPVTGNVSTQSTSTYQGTITGTTFAAVAIYGGTGTVVNYGLLRGGQYGVQEDDGGSVANFSGGTIVGGGNGGFEGNTNAGAGVLVSGASGSIDNSGLIAGGNGISSSGRGITGGDGIDLATGTLTNAGTVAGGKGGDTSSTNRNAGNGGSGVVLLEAGTVTNNATIVGGDGGGLTAATPTGRAGAGGYGVYLVQAGTLINHAVITGGQAGTGGFGFGGAGVYLAANASLINTGTITGGDGGSGGVGGPGAVLRGSGTLNNTGSIIGGGGKYGGPGVLGVHGSTITVVNSGTLLSSGDHGVGLYRGAVTNSASAVVTGHQDAVYIYSSGAAVLNSGNLLGGRYGVEEANGGSVTNQLGGTIVGGGGALFNNSATSGAFGAGISISDGIGVVSNSGSIAGGAGAGYAQNYITGGYGGDGVDLANGTLSNAAGGTINGGQGGGPGTFSYHSNGGVGGAGVKLTTGTLTNAGSILGGQGGAGGFNSNGNPGGNGGDGGDGVALLQVGTIINDANITGGAGGAIPTGAGGRGRRGIGGDGVDLVQGGTLINHAVVTGGTSAGDGLYLGTGASLVNTGTIAGGTGGGTGIFIAGTAAFTNTSDSTVLGGDGKLSFGAGIYRAATGTVTNQGTLIGGNYGAGVRLQQGGAVSNDSYIAGYYGVQLQAAGSVTNLAGGTITGGHAVLVRNGDVNVVNSGTILGSNYGVDARLGGSVTNNVDAVISASTNGAVDIQSVAGTVSNAGTIMGGYYALLDASGGLVTNEQSGTIAGLEVGINMRFAVGTVINAGTISSGQKYAAIYEYYGGKVANSGVILGSVNLYSDSTYVTNATHGTISSYGDAVYLDNTNGTLVNSGVILSSNGYGLNVRNGAGYVTNAATGTISSEYGLYLSYGTVFNAGTITATDAGAYAIYFESSGSTPNRVIAAPGAIFNGYVNGDVFELATGASAGTLSGFGTSITNFGSLVFDKGAQWTVAGNDSSDGLGGVTISGFATGDTIDLTGFVVASETFANNELVLTAATSSSAPIRNGAIGNTATLHIQGAFRTGNFHYASDGSGGTNINLGPSGNYTWTATGTADWNVATDWDLGSVPGQNDNAFIGSAGNAEVTIAGGESYGINGLTILPTNTLLVSGTLAANTIVDNGVLAFGGADQDLDATPLSLGGTIAVEGTYELTFGANEVITQTGTSAAISGASGGVIDNQGVIDAAVAGGDFEIGPVGEFRNDGIISVSNGDTLSFNSDVSGKGGTIDIGANGIADFADAVAASQSLDFTGEPDELILQQPSSFAADILDFGQGSTIDLAGVGADTATWSNDQLTISSKGMTIAVLSLPGDYSADVFLVASDGAGGTAITLQSPAPPAPTALTLDPASDSGIKGDNATVITIPVITGSGTAGDTIILYDGMTVVGTATVAGNGSWAATASSLALGSHTLTATQTDMSGHVSVASGALTLRIDPVPTAPTGLTLSPSTTNITTPVIIGGGTPGETITLLDGVTVIGSATVAANGTWSATSSKLAAGSHSLTATQTDSGGNVSVASPGFPFTISPGAEGLVEFDVTLGQAGHPLPQPYTGPVAGLQNQYIDLTNHNVNLAAGTPNWFIHTGSGDDAIAVSSGTNVLDGGTGSNFLTGGSGTDTFFVDDRGSAADTWSTIVNFHASDAVTVWGVTPQDFNFAFANNEGATGYTGLTLHATSPAHPTASVTFTGFTTADLSSGRITESSGTDPGSGSSFTYFHCNA